MDEYIGQPCIVCDAAFTAEDDIVVCPECGTPYHRACWKKTNCCINTALHESGGSWIKLRQAEMQETLAAEKRAEEAEQAAERERSGETNQPNASLYDGVRLKPDHPTVGLDPNETLADDDVTIGEVAEFVRTNRFYYLPLFRLMKRTGKRFSFNFICLFFPEFYFANRKMWAWTLISMLVNMLLNLPSTMVYMHEQMHMTLPVDVNSAAFERVYSICGIAGLVLSVLFCLFANFLYYRFTVRRIKSIRRSASSDLQYHHDLQQAGGTSAGNVLLALLIEAACAFTVVAVLFFLR